MYHTDCRAERKWDTWRVMVVSFCLALPIAPAGAQTGQQPAPPITVIDGDTVEVDGIRWRIDGIDAPEIHRAMCSLERHRGIVGAARLIALVATHGGHIEPSRTARGKVKSGGFGRHLGRLVLGDGRAWADIAIAEGHAVKWDYGHAPKPDWCTPAAS